MKKISMSELENIQAGWEWSDLGGLACGIGIGLLLTGVGTPLGAVAVAASCTTVIMA